MWYLVHLLVANSTEGIIIDVGKLVQEAQLPQRNSASAAHLEGGARLQPTPPPSPLTTPMRMVESESHNVRTSSVPSVKRTLR